MGSYMFYDHELIVCEKHDEFQFLWQDQAQKELDFKLKKKEKKIQAIVEFFQLLSLQLLWELYFETNGLGI